MVVAGEDNAAAELVVDGVNGVIAPNAGAETIAAAIVRIHEAGTALRESTAGWYRENAETLSLETSVRTVLRDYAGGAASGASPAMAEAGGEPSPRSARL